MQTLTASDLAPRYDSHLFHGCEAALIADPATPCAASALWIAGACRTFDRCGRSMWPGERCTRRSWLVCDGYQKDDGPTCGWISADYCWNGNDC